MDAGESRLPGESVRLVAKAAAPLLGVDRGEGVTDATGLAS